MAYHRHGDGARHAGQFHVAHGGPSEVVGNAVGLPGHEAAGVVALLGTQPVLKHRLGLRRFEGQPRGPRCLAFADLVRCNGFLAGGSLARSTPQSTIFLSPKAATSSSCPPNALT